MLRREGVLPSRGCMATLVRPAVEVEGHIYTKLSQAFRNTFASMHFCTYPPAIQPNVDAELHLLLGDGLELVLQGHGDMTHPIRMTAPCRSRVLQRRRCPSRRGGLRFAFRLGLRRAELLSASCHCPSKPTAEGVR